MTGVPGSGSTGRRRWRFGIAARLAVFHAALLAVILAAVAYETDRGFTSRALQTTDQALSAQVSSFGRAASRRPPGQDMTAFTVAYLRSSVLPSGQQVAVDVNGKTLGSAGAGALLHTRAATVLLADPPPSSRYERIVVDGTATEVLATPLRSDGTVLGTILVAAGLAQLQTDQARVLALAAAEAAVAVLAGAAGSYLLLRRLLRTVGSMTTTAAAIGSGDLDQRLRDPGTGDEVAQLAVTLDWMLDRLSAALLSQRRLLSDVSHQLRTPLTVVRGHLEVLARSPHPEPADVRATVNTAIEELGHMGTLIEDLLLLGRALEPEFCDRQPVDLRALLADAVEAAAVLAPRHWAAPVVPDLVILADEAKLRGAVLNLIDNSVRATGPDDRIRIGATRQGDGGVMIAVDDSGPGIPSGQVEAALTRFGRPGPADSQGSGLGLAIVKAVAEAHGGTFRLSRSDLGGCRAAITLPAAAVVDACTLEA